VFVLAGRAWAIAARFMLRGTPKDRRAKASAFDEKAPIACFGLPGEMHRPKQMSHNPTGASMERRIYIHIPGFTGKFGFGRFCDIQGGD
jgi:hypothetical protein